MWTEVGVGAGVEEGGLVVVDTGQVEMVRVNSMIGGDGREVHG